MDIGKLEYYFLDYLPFKNQFALIELVSGVIPILFCIKYLNFSNKKYLPIYIYSITIFFFEIANNCYSAYSKNNHDIYLIFYLVETALLFWFFSKEIENSKYTKLLIVFFILVSIFLINNIYSTFNLMDDFSSSFQAIVFILITLINYYIILSKLITVYLYKSVLFWINTGVFIYFSGKFFVSLFLFEINSKNDLPNYWNIVSVLLVLNRILIAIGISKVSKEKSIYKSN